MMSYRFCFSASGGEERVRKDGEAGTAPATQRGGAVLKRRVGAVQEAAAQAGSVLAAGPPCDDP